MSSLDGCEPAILVSIGLWLQYKFISQIIEQQKQQKKRQNFSFIQLDGINKTSVTHII